MQKVSLFSKKGALVPLKNQDKINVDELVQKIIDYVRKHSGSSSYELRGNRGDSSFVEFEGKKFFSSINMNKAAIYERQRIFKSLRENEKLINFLVTNPSPKFQSDSNRDGINLDDLCRGTSLYAKYFDKVIELTKGTSLEYIGTELFEKMKNQKVEHINKFNSFDDVLKIEIPMNMSFCCKKVMSTIEFESDGSVVATTFSNGRSEPVMGSISGYVYPASRDNSKIRIYVDNLYIRESIISTKLNEYIIEFYLNCLLKKGFCSKTIGVIDVNMLVNYEQSGDSFRLWFTDGKDKFIFNLGPNRIFGFMKSKSEAPSIKLSDFTFEIPSTQLSSGHLYASNYFINSRRSNMLEVLCSLNEIIFMAHLARWYNILPDNIQTCYPEILSKDQRIMELSSATNPILFNLSGVVTNDAKFSPMKSGYVITGANAGGKTAYANMIAYNQIFAQLGLPVFAKKSKISIVDNILLHYTESKDINSNQSRYSSELKRLSTEVIKEITPFSLVIFDEPFSGTSEVSAHKQAVDVLRVMNHLGCRMVMTTHLHTLIPIVDKLPKLRNNHFTLPRKKAGDYKMKNNGLAKSSGELLAQENHVTYSAMMKTVKIRK